MPANPIHMPSGYATAFAIGFADPTSGNLSIVESGRPLPVATVPPGAAAPLTGTATATGSFGPFTAAQGRPIVITLAGTWTGSVTVQRSVDGGATRRPLTVGGQPWGSFTGNVCEPVWEEFEDGTTFYLAVTLASGSLTYRLAQ